MSTSLSIIKSHKGLIEIISEVNEGTTVKIYIPAFENTEIKKITETSKDISVSKNELILIIDDDELILEMLSDLLDFLGYRSIMALDGFEGIDLYLKNIDEVKLVISDMVMPKMDGFETIKSLLKINPNLKIIMASGFETKYKIDKVMEMGVSDFLEKPYNTEKLLYAINKALSLQWYECIIVKTIFSLFIFNLSSIKKMFQSKWHAVEENNKNIRAKKNKITWVR